MITTPKMFLYKEDKFDQLIQKNQWHITESHAHGAFTLDRLRNYVNDRTKWDIVVLQPINNLLKQISVFALFAMALYLMSDCLKYFFLNPKMWYVCSIVNLSIHVLILK